VTGGWIKLHNEELHDLYPSTNEDGMGGAFSRHGRMRNAHGLLVGRPGRKEHLEGIGVNGRVILKWTMKK
jgi:hypothetical protein